MDLWRIDWVCREVREEMLNRPRFELYNPGDVVGQSV